MKRICALFLGLILLLSALSSCAARPEKHYSDKISVSSSDAENYGFPQGVLVNSVESGSCGEKAGLRRYDIITGIDNTTIKSLDELSAALKSYRAGDTATLEVYRSGKTMQMTVTFDEKPQTTTTATDNSAQQPSENQQGGQQDSQQSGGSSGWGFPWNILP